MEIITGEIKIEFFDSANKQLDGFSSIYPYPYSTYLFDLSPEDIIKKLFSEDEQKHADRVESIVIEINPDPIKVAHHSKILGYWKR